MLVLGIDTSFYYLSLVLIEDDRVIDRVYEKCERKQSELLVGRIADLLKRNDMTSKNPDAVVVTIGPGSYTGVRIGLSFAKIYCSNRNIPLYTLSTLQLYAGKEAKIVMTDARAQRCFFGIYDQGEAIIADCVVEITEAEKLREKYLDFSLYGDLRLIDQEDDFSDICDNFLFLKDRWKKIKNIHVLSPKYLKEQSAYGQAEKS